MKKVFTHALANTQLVTIGFCARFWRFIVRKVSAKINQNCPAGWHYMTEKGSATADHAMARLTMQLCDGGLEYSDTMAVDSTSSSHEYVSNGVCIEVFAARILKADLSVGESNEAFLCCYKCMHDDWWWCNSKQIGSRGRYSHWYQNSYHLCEYQI